MSLGTTLLAVVFVAVLIAAFFPRARVRAVAQIVTGTVAFLAGLTTVALVVGGFALEAQGGGVMLLFAVVPALVAWIAGQFFLASRRYSALRRQPVEQQRDETLREFETTFEGGLERLARLRAERNRITTSTTRRAELDRTIAHEQRVLGLLPALRPAIGDLRNYEQEVADSPTEPH